ncbi:MAG: cystathionine gamma-lyase [Micrococcales bacterium 73-13]|nr:MAG: cystathionine gamma-lyase [Micrococcales bacterium 73-13]
MTRPDRRDSRTLRESSTAVHAGNLPDPTTGAIKTPLTLANSYEFPYDPTSIDWSVNDQLLYTRVSGTNQLGLQAKLAALEGAEAAAAFASGVAATHAVFFTYLNAGDHVVCSEVVYEATFNLLTDLLPRKYGISATFVDATDPAAVEAAMRPETRLVFAETVANPTTLVADLPMLAGIAHAHDALLVVDSTFTPPPVLRPIEHGADLVVHSITKYINGHGDGLGGAVLGRASLIDPIKQQAMVDAGGVIAPFNAWLIQRGAATLPLRMRQVNESARRIAEFLDADPRVAWVRYPGLASHPQHELAARLMPRGCSGMIAFAPHGDTAALNAFVSRLRLITSATSLGHDESLIAHFAKSGPRQDRYGRPFTDHGTLRLSVGIEDVEDLLADLDAALG